MTERVLVRMRDRYPTASRMTQWRIRQQPGFPNAVDQLGTEWFYADELEAFEEKRRRLASKKTTTKSEAT